MANTLYEKAVVYLSATAQNYNDYDLKPKKRALTNFNEISYG